MNPTPQQSQQPASPPRMPNDQMMTSSGSGSGSAFRGRANLFIVAGLVLILSAVGVIVATFGGVISQEIRYAASSPDPDVQVVLPPTPLQVGEIGSEVTPEAPEGAIVAASSEFSVVIPKIGANQVVIADVDPFDKSAYNEALKNGIAHAEGSSLPTEPGNMFLFSHSSVNFYLANQYNTEFYLLSKLESGDEIFVAYEGKKYVYRVTELVEVEPSDVEYLTEQDSDSRHTITLMTCTPTGTSLRRLLVQGELVSQSL